MITSVIRFPGDLDVFEQPQCNRTVVGTKYYFILGYQVFKRSVSVDIECVDYSKHPDPAFTLYMYRVKS